MCVMPPRGSNNTSGNFCCPEPRCRIDGAPRIFARASLLRQHYLKVHAEKSLKCTKCSKAFAIAYLLRQHELECNKRVQCKDCGVEFLHQSSLWRHHRISHHGGARTSIPHRPSMAGKSVEQNPDESQRSPTVVTILPLQILPIFVPAPGPAVLSNAATCRRPTSTASGRKLKPLLPKKVAQKAVSVQASPMVTSATSANTTTATTNTRCCGSHHKSTVSTQASTWPGRSVSSQAVEKTPQISVSTSTTGERHPAPSIATQTYSNQCNVAVGIDDDIFEDLQRLFAKAADNDSNDDDGNNNNNNSSINNNNDRNHTNNSINSSNNNDRNHTNNSINNNNNDRNHTNNINNNDSNHINNNHSNNNHSHHDPKQLAPCSPNSLDPGQPDAAGHIATNHLGGGVNVGHVATCPLLTTTNVQHAETQTYQPSFADTHIQTSSFFDEFDDGFLPSAATRSHEALFVDVAVGGPAPFDEERLFGHMEVQTIPFEPQVQHFGVQTASTSACASTSTSITADLTAALQQQHQQQQQQHQQQQHQEQQTSDSLNDQTLSASGLDVVFSQTKGVNSSDNNMELSSVETQTIEQFFNCLESCIHLSNGSCCAASLAE